MAFDVEGARRAGYSDSEITDFLGKENKFDVNAARKAGYSDSELVQHFRNAAPTAPVKAPEVAPQDQSVFRQVADVPLKIGAGAVTGVRMIADAFGANTAVSKSLRGVEDEIAALYSAQSKNDSKEIARIMKEAEDKGILDQLAAGVKAMSVAPVDLISNSLGTAAPAIAAGLATLFTGGAPLVGAGLTLGTGAIMGAGTVKSAIYDATKQVLTEKTKMTPEQIEAAAVKAQEYDGKNLDQILIGAGIGAVGARTGAEPIIARQLAKDIIGRTTAEQAATTAATQTTGREATRAAVRQGAAEETARAAERGMVKQGAVTAAKEFATEFPQGGQEQLAQNLALQREGFDVPTFRGVVSQGTLEGLAGAGMGAAIGGREGSTARFEKEKADALEASKNQIQQQESNTPATPAGSVETNPEIAALLNPAVPIGQETKPAATPQVTTTEDPALQAMSGAELEAKFVSEGMSSNEAFLKASEIIDARKAAEQAPTESREETVDRLIQERTTELEELEKKREALGFAPKLRRNSSQKVREAVAAIEELEKEIGGVKQALWFLNTGREIDRERSKNAGATVGDAGGTSTAVAVSTDTGAATGTTGETKPSGVATVAPTIVNVDGRTELQPATVTSELKPPERIDTTPGYVVTEQSNEENLKAAMELADQYERTAEEDYQKNLDESKVDEEGKPRTIPRYEVLKEGEESKPGVYEITAEMREEYDLTRDAKREEGVLIPAWNDLKPDEKDVYFDNIRQNTIEEHNNAAAALDAYRKKKGADKLNLTTEQQRFVNAYEQNRAISSKLFGVEFPAWGDLTNEDRQVYLQQIISNAGLQQDVGFANLGVHLLQKDRRITNDQKRNVALRMVEMQNKIEQEHKQNKEKYDKLNESNQRTSTQGLVPDNVLAHIKGNNIQGVLQFLRTSANNKFFRNIAQAIFSMKLNTQIQMVDKLPGKDVAIYDPASDTIFVTPFGATETVLMHELVHAATIKVLNIFLTKNGVGLTREQVEAAEHLQDIMNDTRKLFAKKFPEAYKNLYEFVSYSMTNKSFQIELATLEQGAEMAETILPEKKSMWSEFKLQVANLLGITKELFNRGNLNMKSGLNYRMEIAAAFNDIMAVPEKGTISMKPLAASGPANGIDGENSAYSPDRNEAPDGKTFVKKLFTTAEGWRRVSTWLVDRRTEAKYLFDTYYLAGKISRDLNGKFNNFYEWAVTSAALGENEYINRVQDTENKLHNQVTDYATLIGQDLKPALNRLHRIAEAMHEPERRLVKFILTVGLNTQKLLTQNGVQISPAERRVQIVGDERTNKPGLIHKTELTQAQLKALRNELTYLANTYADAFGDGPRVSDKVRERLNRPAPPGKAKQGMPIDINDGAFNVLGLEQSEVALREQQLADMQRNNPAEYNAIQAIYKTMRELHKTTTELNREGNYWSTPVSNLVGLYGFKNYMPFKGKDRGKKQADDSFDFDSRRNGRELQEYQAAMDGRFSVSDNPILQSLSDAIRAAGRAGRKYYTQSIKNAIEAGIIPGKVAKHYEFLERNNIDMKKYKGEDYIFHYNKDGSLDILKITNQKLLNSLRYTYQDTNTLLDTANRVTGFFGSLHTRYNYNFAPMNFIRDALFNSFNIGADRGPAAALKYATSMAANIVANNGIAKAWEVASLHDRSDPGSKARLAKMVKEDAYVKNMVEYLENGSKTTYTQSFSLKTNMEKLAESTGKSRTITKLDQFNLLVDTWNNMFEFTSRAAVYAQEKERALKEQIANGLSTTPGPNGQMSAAEKAAAVQAATYAKEMTNFEQKGTYSRGMGALYMFIRPSAISAKRSIEAVAPAFRNIDDVVAGLPANIQSDPAAVAKFRANYAEKQRNARIMITALSGMGYLMYMMAVMMAPDDELGRNNVKNDNMQQWTRNARFHLPNSVSVPMGLGKDVIFQIPWSFGLGAFAAAGAQVGGMTQGITSLRDGMSNIVLSIMADSFVPIPLSKIPASEAPLAFTIDSLMPTVIRPLTEFLMNKNGIGQDINSATARRMGDAYTGGDKIPEVYKKAAQELFKSDVPGFGVGTVKVSPNTLYFFTNSYLDGIGKLAELSYGMFNLSKGAKDFNPKTDLPLLGSFFGSKSNIDSREFSSVEKQIKAIQQNLNTFDTVAPVEGIKYDLQNPMHRDIVEIYKRQLVQLNKLREDAEQIRLNQSITPKQRDAMLKMTIFEQNLMKHEMIAMFKAYGVKP